MLFPQVAGLWVTRVKVLYFFDIDQMSCKGNGLTSCDRLWNNFIYIVAKFLGVDILGVDISGIDIQELTFWEEPVILLVLTSL